MQIKGKQIKDGSVKQEKLNVTTNSILSVSSVTNAEYVNTNSVNRVEALTYATLNLEMIANVATIGDLACDKYVVEFPISNVMVKVNNVNVTVGEGKDCYFSPNGTTIRTGGQAEKGDYLYWNSTRFDLDNTDEIDFIYITASETVELSGGTSVVLDPYYPALNVKYTGESGTTMTVVIDGVSFIVGNVAGQFVWDIGGLNEHTFTTVGESWLQVVNTVDYTIWYDGLGSLLFSIKLGNFDVDNKIYLIGLNDAVNALYKDINNNIVIGGNFITYNPYNSSKICSINQDGSFDSTFDIGTGFNGSVIKIIKDNNKYVMGGYFTTYKNLTQRYICRLNQDGSIDSAFVVGTGFNNYVQSFIQDSNGKYIVAGYFTSYNGTTRNRIIRLNQDGSLDTTFVIGTGFNNNVYFVMEDSNGKYIIGGIFTSYNGITQNRICRLNQDGSLDTTFIIGTGFNNQINSILQDSTGKYIIGGAFSTYKGLTQNRICRLNQDGSLDTTFVVGTGFDQYISSIIQDSNGKYVIGGIFTSYNGITQNRICRLNQDGSLDTTFIIGTGFNNQINSILQDSTGKYIIGGAFSTYKGLTQNTICRLNQDGSLDTTFVIGTGFDGIVYSIIYESNVKFIIGGGFNSYNGIIQNRILKITQDNYIDTTFDVGTGFNGQVNSIIQDSNGKYVMGGTFNTYKGLTQNRIIRLNQDGSLDSTFNIGTGFNNPITSIIQDSNGKYVMGGAFTTYKGLTQNRIIRLNQDGSLDSTFVVGTGFNNQINSILQDSNGKYIIGGAFTTYKGLTQNYICRLNQDGSLDSTFIVGTGFNNYVRNIKQDSNGKYVIGGYFTTYKGLTQNRIVRLNQDGSLDSTFVIGTGFNIDVNTIIQDSNGKYIIGGEFTTYNGLTQNRICRLNQDGSLDSTFVVGNGFNFASYSIIEDSNGKYVIGGEFTTYKDITQNRIIRLNQDGSSNTI